MPFPGTAGFEPAHAGTKIRRLTACLRPNKKNSLQYTRKLKKCEGVSQIQALKYRLAH